MKYKGRFATVNDDIVQVTIETNCTPSHYITHKTKVTNANLPKNVIKYKCHNNPGSATYSDLDRESNTVCYIDDRNKKAGETYGDNHITVSTVSYTNVTIVKKEMEKGLYTVTFSGEINLITAGMFNNDNLEEIWLPDSVTVLYSSTFANNDYLTAINANNITDFHTYCCANCPNLSWVDLSNATLLATECFMGCSAFKEDIIINNATIGENAFRDCTSITKAYIANVTTIDVYTFYNCTALSELQLSNVGEVCPLSFGYCTGIKNIIVTDGIPDLPTRATFSDSAFSHASEIGELHIDPNAPNVQQWYDVLPHYTKHNDEIELKFAGEQPVVISMQSDDGIFSPIKSRSCTITLTVKDTYYDIYTAKVNGTQVKVENLTNAEVLFFGYVTPCQYNQPYADVVDQLEIECVDALSTLKDVDYNYINATQSVIPFIDMLKYLIYDIACYTGNIYGTAAIPSVQGRAFINEKINDENFYDDDDEHTPWSCYEVLEEIAKYYGVSIVPDGEDVYIIDYRATVNHGITYGNYTQPTNGTLQYYNYTNNTTVTLPIEKILGINDYLGNGHNVELDEVYNKVSITANVYDINGEDISVDPLGDDIKVKYIPYTGDEWHYHRGGVGDFVSYIKNFTYLDGQKWYSRYFDIYYSEDYADGHYIPTEFTNTGNGYYHIGYANNDLSNLCGIPLQTFTYNITTTSPKKIDWTDYIAFYTQPIQYYLSHGEEVGPYPELLSGQTFEQFWYTKFYKNFQIPALTMVNEENFTYSPSQSGITNYIVFKGDILWTYGYRIYNMTDGSLGYIEFPYTDISTSEEETVLSRSRNTTGYNSGWEMLECQLQIGNKYWNGVFWTETKCTFFIKYHKQDVMVDNETLVFFNWNVPACNFTLNDMINENDCQVIPIVQSDNLSGPMKFTIFTPRTPFNEQIVRGGGYVEGLGGVTFNDRIYFRYKQCCPIIYMKGLSITLKTVDTTADFLHMNEEEKSDKDIVYSNAIDDSNVTEMDDLELKINTCNLKYIKDKPVARSYVMVGNRYLTEGFYDNYSGERKLAEEILIEKYYDHYSVPKKIYNAEVRDYYKPYLCVEPTVFNGTRFVVDEQEYDVKSNINNITLIEY